MSNPEKCIQSNKTQINNNIQINVTNDQWLFYWKM
jgi:hypothetical protein